MRSRLLVAALAAATLTPITSTAAARGDCSRACVQRVKAHERATIRHRHARALAAEMRGYRAHPMPSCTWLTESGAVSTPPFALSRYRIVNTSSGAAGKFQFLLSTWAAIGGERYSGKGNGANYARPVYQERMARVLMARAGLRGTWAKC